MDALQVSDSAPPGCFTPPTSATSHHICLNKRFRLCMAKSNMPSGCHCCAPVLLVLSIQAKSLQNLLRAPQRLRCPSESASTSFQCTYVSSAIVSHLAAPTKVEYEGLLRMGHCSAMSTSLAHFVQAVQRLWTLFSTAVFQHFSHCLPLLKSKEAYP